MDAAQAQGLSQGLDLLHIARDGPQGWVLGLVRSAATELVVGHHPVAVVGQGGVGFANVITRQTRAAVEAQQNLVARAEAVGHGLVAVDGDVDGLVGRAPLPHGVYSFLLRDAASLR